MAITTKTMTLARVHPRKTYFGVAFGSDDLTGCEVIKAAHATKSYYVEELLLCIYDDITVTFGDDESGDAVVNVAVYASGGHSGPLNFSRNPLKLTAAKAITIDANGAGTVSGYVIGYTTK